MARFCPLIRACLLCATALVGTGPAVALPLNYLIEFDEGSTSFVTAEWTGTYTVDAGVLTAFSAQIGGCFGDLQSCTYDVLTTSNDDPDDTDFLITVINVGVPNGGNLNLNDEGPFPNLWGTSNTFDQLPNRFGSYRTTLLPEPGASLLVATGLLGLVARRKRRS